MFLLPIIIFLILGFAFRGPMGWHRPFHHHHGHHHHRHHHRRF